MDIKSVVKDLTLEEKADLCSGQDFWHTKAVERLGVKSVMMTDGPHGLRKTIGHGGIAGVAQSAPAVTFPTASALACSFDRDLVYKVGAMLGEECQSEDVGMLLGPGMNIKRSPLCGRNFEYFSADPYLTGELAAAQINGIQSQNVAACPKHFCANNQETRRMTSNSVVDERTLHEIYLAGFEIAVTKGKPKALMCSYNRINGAFGAENPLLNETLREKFGFDGFVVTDWGAVKDFIKGIQAGLDLEMPGPDLQNAQKIVNAVNAGTLALETVDKSVSRIIEFVRWFSENRPVEKTFNFENAHALAVKAASESAVLLKNDGPVLPLAKTAKIAVIGEFAEKSRYQGGGSSFTNSYQVTNALDFFPAGVIYAKSGDEAVEAAKDADVAVIFAGLPDAYESEGYDRTHINLPDEQNALIAKIAGVQSKTVVVLQNGSPVSMPWIDNVAAVLEMYLGGEGTGEAAVKLLYGEVNPSGKLAESFPLKLSDTPSFLNFPGVNDETVYHERVYVDYRYYDKKEMPVLFPFGHGLSYTRFEYSDLRLDKSNISDTETVTLTVKVTNAGTVTGKESVQLYVSDLSNGSDRPVRELKEFTKVALLPGETKEVAFVLDKRAFSYYTPVIHDWYAPSGEYEVSVGASSRDLRLCARLHLEASKKLPVVFTKYSTFGEVSATNAGQEFFAKMMSQAKERQGEAQINLGEGSEQLVATAMQEMPLAAIAQFANISEGEVDGIVQMLNNAQQAGKGGW